MDIKKVGTGEQFPVMNRQPTAISVTITNLSDGTVVKVVLAPGATAWITKGAGEISVHFDSHDDQPAGLTLVKPAD